jgi:hypothetical protein
MDALHDRLADLADDAPTGGAPAADLWTRGKRARRLRVAAVAATVLVVGVVGTGIGVRLADGNGDRAEPAPADTVDITLPIEYPVGEELPDLGLTPGPLATIWLVPGVGGGAPEAVGLVAETGRFGTLPIDVSRNYMTEGGYFALAPDGRRIAYDTPTDELVVRDLVSGESYAPTFEIKPRPERWYTWIDATHLAGHDVRGSEDDGWVWQPGTAPKVVSILTYVGSPFLGPYAGRDPWFLTDDAVPQECLSLRDEPGGRAIPVLCDLVGVIGPDVALTHDGDGAVVALDIEGVENPALRQVVATAGAPPRVTFATDLIGEALDVAGGAS